MDKKFKILNKQHCYSGFFQLDKYTLQHDLYQGGETKPLVRELFERGHAVAVLLYDPVLDEVVLTEQFRIGALSNATGAWLLEIVAGMIEPNEQELEVAHREVMEESGCIIEKLKHIGQYYVSPGGTTETISLYCAKVDATTATGFHGLEAEGEDIKVVRFSFQQVIELVKNGTINNYSTVLSIQWLQLNKTDIITEFST
jgi:ADP-ribose pyrophosphatase